MKSLESTKPLLTSGHGHWRIDREEWQTAMKKSHIIMITPISNPSGWDLHIEDRDWIIKQAEENDVIVIADEAYNDAYRHIAEYRAIHTFGDNCISINSLTKVYGMGPIRFGWLVADKETIAIAKNIFMTFSGVMASPTMRIAAEALKNLAKVDQAIDYYREENFAHITNCFGKTWYCLE